MARWSRTRHVSTSTTEDVHVGKLPSWQNRPLPITTRRLRISVVKATGGPDNGDPRPWDFGAFVRTVSFFNAPSLPSFLKRLFEAPTSTTVVTPAVQKVRKTHLPLFESIVRGTTHKNLRMHMNLAIYLAPFKYGGTATSRIFIFIMRFISL